MQVLSTLLTRRCIGDRAQNTTCTSANDGWLQPIAVVAGVLALSVTSRTMALPPPIVTSTLEPVADSYTQQSTPTTNYGNQSTVLIRQDSANTLTRNAYFEFDLSSLNTGGGKVIAARLELFGSQDQGGTGVSIKAIGGTANTPWSESALNYGNAQTLTGVNLAGTALATTAISPPPAQSYSWDVTPYILSRLNYANATIGLSYTAANLYRSTFNSKEATENRPRLVITKDHSVPGPRGYGFSLAPIGDTYTQQGTPTTNYGAQPTVLIRQDAANTLTRNGYFEFDLSSLPAGTITDARLVLYGSQDQGGTGVSIKALGGTATTTWNELALNYSNAPSLIGVNFTGPPLSTIPVAPPPATNYVWDVTSYVAPRKGAGNATIALAYTAANTYRSTFNSREATVERPRLGVMVDTSIEAGGDGRLPGSCPSGYTVQPGLNTNFPHAGINRAFVLNLPTNMTTARPVWVPLTSSVESTTENLGARGGNAAMTTEGFIVIGPVRQCANQDPSGSGTNINGGTCNRAGTDGWTWNAWNEGRVFGTAGDLWKYGEGNDSEFLEAVVRCVAKTYPVDDRRIFLGGIESGGTMTNRALLFNSDFWAGGAPISGEWYVTQDNGTAYPGPDEFAARRAAVAANPNKIFQGRVGRLPLFGTPGTDAPMSPMIVITLWGGPTDIWSCAGVLCKDSRPSTQVSSNYFSMWGNIVHVACTGHHGLQWPTFQRDAWNRWVLRTLASHPKRTAKSAFVLPPLGSLSTDYSCVVGPYSDHY